MSDSKQGFIEAGLTFNPYPEFGWDWDEMSIVLLGVGACGIGAGIAEPSAALSGAPLVIWAVVRAVFQGRISDE